MNLHKVAVVVVGKLARMVVLEVVVQVMLQIIQEGQQLKDYLHPEQMQL